MVLSKIPYSQRKPVFSIRFLVVGVPYHSQYMAGATDKVMEDLKGEELWTPADLKIPVYHTENGMLTIFDQNFHIRVCSLTLSLISFKSNLIFYLRQFFIFF